MSFSCSGSLLFYLGLSPPSPCGGGRHQHLFTKRPLGRCWCAPLRRVAATDTIGARLPLSWASLPVRASCRRGRVRTAPRHVAATGNANARLLLSRASPNGSATCGGDWHCRCAPPVVAGESERLSSVWRRLALPMCTSCRRGRVRTAPRRVAATGSDSVSLPLSRASPNGSAACGGDWLCQCAPPIVMGESERLRGVWRRLVAPVRASRCRGRVRTAPRCVVATGTASARLPASRASL